MASPSPTRSLFPKAVGDAAAAPDSNGGGDPRAPTAARAQENGRSSPAAAAAAARSTASLFASGDTPAYDGSTSRAPGFSGAPPGPPAPPANISATSATTFPNSVPHLHQALHPSSAAATGPPGLKPVVPPRRGSSRGSSAVGERPSVLERRAVEAREMAIQLNVAAVEQEVLQVERQLEAAQRARESGGPYRGKDGAELAAEEKRLAHKEGLLREKEVQLRKEGNMLLRMRSDQQRRRSSVAARPNKRLSIISAQAFPDDPEEQEAEQQRIEAQIEAINKARRGSVNTGDSRRESRSTRGGLESFVDGGEPEGLDSDDDDGGPAGDMSDDGCPDDSSVMVKYKTGVDRRLMLKMQAFNQPVLVGTLLSGFTLVLFDVATKDLARRLAVLAFALEVSASTVLSLIMFRGQQLYSQTTYIKEKKNRAKPFLRTMWTATRLSLVLFSLGVVAFVVSFVVEAGDEMGDVWLAVFTVILCPTAIAAVLFPASTEQIKQRPAPYKPEPAPANETD
eukprot:g10306.t1